MRHGKRKAEMVDGGDPGLNETGIVGGVDEDWDGDGDRDRAIYLVACRAVWYRLSKPYALYKFDLGPPDASFPSSMTSEYLDKAVHLKCSAGGKTFISMRSAHRAWIIGVGGALGETVIFDTKTQKVIRGPNLISAKWCPVLTVVGEKVYALSKTPSWKGKMDPDFPPWFEVLDLSEAEVVTAEDSHYLDGCSWKELQIPPCLPWKLTPLRYTMLPVTIVRSYVVIGPYMLVSFNQPWGTYAFDTNSSKWHKVYDKELPFVGCAVPLGSMFFGSSQQNGAIDAYSMNVKASDRDGALKLSIHVLPVEYEGEELDAEQCLCSLENGRLCLLNFSVDKSSMTKSKHGESFLKKAYVNMSIYQIEDLSLLNQPQETLLALKSGIAFSNRQEEAFIISSSRRGISPDAFTFLYI